MASPISIYPNIPCGVPLVLKARCEDRIKRIRFPPELTLLSFRDFHRRISKALRFEDMEFSITWCDDDGEQVEIANNEDLREALLYFSPSTTLTADDHLTMRVEVSVDSSISLSDYEGSEWKSGYASSNAASSSSEDSFMKGRYAERNSTLRSSSSPNPMTQRDNKLYGTIPSRTYTSSQSHNAFPELSELEDVTELVNSPVSRQMFSSVDNTEEWDKGKEELCQKWYDACRNDLESLQIGFSPSPIPSSISSRSWDASQRMSSSNSDSGNSVDTRALRLRKPRIPRFEEADETNIHHGIRCRSCGIYPIIGIRYHCASCTRPADFCVNCERTGQAERNSPSHSTSHMMIKITIPLQGTQAAQHLNMVLQGLKTRLVQEARSSTLSLSNPPETETAAAAARENTTDQTLPEHALKCSFCSRTITQVRYLCANCPIVTQSTRDGYNLCTTCEMASLQCHDPTHFFLKINIITRQGYRPDDSRRVALADRWEVRETSGSGPLLPQLYIHSDDLHLPTPLDSRNCVVRIGDGIRVEENADGRSILIGDQASGISIDRHGIQFGNRRFLSPPQTNDLQSSIELRGLRTSPSRQIVPMENLVHASILCDNCFQVIHGAWYRCCHCTTSYDLCMACERRIAHDPAHSFAVFKQPVDLDLFKSCVDHIDAGDSLGASRPMIEYCLS